VWSRVPAAAPVGARERPAIAQRAVRVGSLVALFQTPGAAVNRRRRSRFQVP